MKVEKRFKKKKEKKEKKPKHESYAIFGEWVSGGEESSASSSDESNKKFTTRMGSSSNTCFMAKGMNSEVMMTPTLLQLMNFLTLFMSTKKSLRNNQKKLKP